MLKIARCIIMSAATYPLVVPVLAVGWATVADNAASGFCPPIISDVKSIPIVFACELSSLRPRFNSPLNSPFKVLWQTIVSPHYSVKTLLRGPTARWRSGYFLQHLETFLLAKLGNNIASCLEVLHHQSYTAGLNNITNISPTSPAVSCSHGSTICSFYL